MHGFAWTAAAWGMVFGLWPVWLACLILDRRAGATWEECCYMFCEGFRD